MIPHVYHKWTERERERERLDRNQLLLYYANITLYSITPAKVEIIFNNADFPRKGTPESSFIKPLQESDLHSFSKIYDHELIIIDSKRSSNYTSVLYIQTRGW